MARTSLSSVSREVLRLVALLVAAAWAGGSAAQESGFTLDPPPREVILGDAGNLYDPTTITALVADAAAADRLIAAAGAYRLLGRNRLSALDMEMVTFRLPESVGGPAAIAELEALEPGATAGVNHAYRSDPDSGAAQARQFADRLIGWPGQGCKAHARVGIIDTDLAPGALDLASARIESARFTSAGADTSHGTAVARLIAGPGRLKGVTLYHASVVDRPLGRDAMAGVDSLIRALDWMQANEVRVVNVSLAGPYNKLLDRTLQAAARRGMIVVAAAGNNGRNGPPRYPAAARETIAVTAVDADGAAYRRAPQAPHIDIAAPGVDVFIDTGAGRYFSGTSIAAPFVTAAIASDPQAVALGSAQAVRDWLARNARDLGAPGRDAQFGFGLLQLSPACTRAD
jgi:subtilisin family serine protease